MASTRITTAKNEIEVEYWERVCAYFLEHYGTYVQEGPWSTKAVDFIINQVLIAEKRTKNKLPIETAQHNLLNKYEVITDNIGNKKFLIIKREDVRATRIRRVVPVEDCLDLFQQIFLDVHRKDIEKNMISALSNYIYPKKCLQIFLEVCGCNLNKKQLKIDRAPCRFPAKTGLIEIVHTGKTNEQDDMYCYLLIYMDASTGYLILRPLTVIADLEVTMELYKLLLEYGIPDKVVLYSILPEQFWESVFIRIKQLLPNFQFPWEIKKTSLNDVTPITKTITEDLYTWMLEGGKDWYMGYHIIQWKYNNKSISTCDLGPIVPKTRHDLYFSNVYVKDVDDFSAKCAVCNITLDKILYVKCIMCSKLVHLKCVRKLIKPKLSAPVITGTCTYCYVLEMITRTFLQ